MVVIDAARCLGLELSIGQTQYDREVYFNVDLTNARPKVQDSESRQAVTLVKCPLDGASRNRKMGIWRIGKDTVFFCNVRDYEVL